MPSRIGAGLASRSALMLQSVCRPLGNPGWCVGQRRCTQLPLRSNGHAYGTCSSGYGTAAPVSPATRPVLVRPAAVKRAAGPQRYEAAASATAITPMTGSSFTVHLTENFSRVYVSVKFVYGRLGNELINGKKEIPVLVSEENAKGATLPPLNSVRLSGYKSRQGLQWYLVGLEQFLQEAQAVPHEDGLLLTAKKVTDPETGQGVVHVTAQLQRSVQKKKNTDAAAATRLNRQSGHKQGKMGAHRRRRAAARPPGPIEPVLPATAPQGPLPYSSSSPATIGDGGGVSTSAPPPSPMDAVVGILHTAHRLQLGADDAAAVRKAVRELQAADKVGYLQTAYITTVYAGSEGEIREVLKEIVCEAALSQRARQTQMRH